MDFFCYNPFFDDFYEKGLFQPLHVLKTSKSWALVSKIQFRRVFSYIFPPMPRICLIHNLERLSKAYNIYAVKPVWRYFWVNFK